MDAPVPWKEDPSGGFREGFLQRYDRVGSTMDVARTAPAFGKPLTVVARSQSSGRGRYDRSWVSPATGGIYLTVRIPWGRPVPQAPAVSLGTALAVAKVAREVGCPDVTIKWPNDLLLGGLKAAGLLAEMATTPDGPSLLVGIGINVSMPRSYLDTVGQPATSLQEASGGTPDLEGVLGTFLRTWSDIDRRLETEGFRGIAEEYRAYSDLQGREFRLATPEAEERVRFEGITDDGALRVRRMDGSVLTTFGGELLPP